MRPTSAQRQEEFRRVERWLKNLYDDSPVRFHVLALTIASVMVFLPQAMVWCADFLIALFRR